MIGKGAQYLTAAGFGRYRITAASLGSAKVIWPGWLTAATKQAIMDAFGVDGPAVIRATNEYLNGIAASDKAKAQQIADWLNTYVLEDAHIVYSLVPTLGVDRFIYSNVGPYINLNIAPTEKTEVELKIRTTAQSSYWRHIFGCSSLGIIQSAAGNYVFLHGGNNNGTYRSTIQNKIEILKTGKTYCYTSTAGTASISGRNIASSTSMQLFRCNGWSDPLPATYIAYCKIIDDGIAVREMYPFIRNGVNGMIDVLSGTFYANAGSGSFTISETPTP